MDRALARLVIQNEALLLLTYLTREAECLHTLRNLSFKVCIKEDGDWCPPFSFSEGEIDRNEDEEDSEKENDDTFILDDSDNDSFVEDSKFNCRDRVKVDESFSVEGGETKKSDRTSPGGDRNGIAFQDDDNYEFGANHHDEVEGSLLPIKDNVDVSKDMNNVDGTKLTSQVANEGTSSKNKSSLANSDGPSGPIHLPDLNNPLPSSEPNRKILSHSKSQNRKAVSAKFKDIIRASKYSNRKSKNSCADRSSNNESLSSSNSNPPSKDFSTSSDEIERTVQIGCAIGYQIQGAEEVIREAINGEGANDVPK
ncbi:hypothetical protein L2E82_29070 [Cichorium intybus]|uniref:Uncharacterized protein n=1 Tax=Cichorium intybus TaxID=13427 RepID=A0ACB9CX13_CICIN|nr:hypothetical protein L2E82_29070 [Cichorium intybus]